MITDAKVIYYIGTAIRANGDLRIYNLLPGSIELVKYGEEKKDGATDGSTTDPDTKPSDKGDNTQGGGSENGGENAGTDGGGTDAGSDGNMG